MHIEKWDEFRHILAMAEFGSVLKEPRHTGASHSTVLRQVTAKRVDGNVPNDHPIIGTDSFLALQTMAALGLGIAVLRCSAGDGDGRRARLPKATPKLTLPLWDTHHDDATDTQQICAVLWCLLRFLADQRERIRLIVMINQQIRSDESPFRYLEHRIVSC